MYELKEEQGEQIETLRVYVYPEEPKRPLWPLSRASRDNILGIGTIIFLLCGIIALCCIPNQPAYAIQTVSVPAHSLPLAHFRVASAIVPTGTRSYPATTATGTLTIYNGSILSQELPAGFIVTSTNGVEIVTDVVAIIPAGNPPTSYGTATVPAHAVAAGNKGNIPAGSVDATYGTSLFIKNLAVFAGGHDAHTERYATSGDIQQAVGSARSILTLQEHQHPGLLASPCQETTAQQGLVLIVSWACQFVTFTPPIGATVLSVRAMGNRIVLQVRVALISHQMGLPGK